MAQILAEVQRKISHYKNNFSAEAKIMHCDSMLHTHPSQSVQMETAFMLACSLVEYGDEKRAIEWFEKLVPVLDPRSEAYDQLQMRLGTAYMRLAERNNCVNHHGPDACIMPLRGTGIHRDKAAGRKAVEVFTGVLKKNPQNLDARWLLNIMYMTLGEYPSKVPPEFLIPGLDKQSAVQVQPFADYAARLGLLTSSRAGGSIVDDFDNDGYLDIVVSAWGLDDPMRFFRNNGDGTFADYSRQSGLAGVTGGLNLLQTDYNNDGWLDIFVLRGAWQGQAGFGEQPNSLLRNNADGTFTDVTIEAGLLSFRPTQTGQWADFNRDGWLDLVIGNETTSDKEIYPCELYINNQNGTFTNVAGPQSGFDAATFVKGVAVGDYDNDGWPDIFLSSLSTGKLLFRNKGIAGKAPVFEDVTKQSGVADNISRTFPAWFFDYDNDGWLDIFMCNYEFDHPLSAYAAREALQASDKKEGKPYLYHNNRNGTFTNVTASMDIGQVCFSMGSNFGDIDNDGWLDFYLGTGNPHFMSLIPNRLYKNLGGKKFADVTVSSRVGNLQKGHGVSFADLDNDGDQDIHIKMGGAYRGDDYPNALYLNPGQGDNNWINIKLEGTKSNRAAVGAKVALKFTENGTPRTVVREVNPGGSFGCSPLRRELGIGKASVIEEIAVTWPTGGAVQVLKNVQPNQFIKIREGQEGFEVVNLKKLPFQNSKWPKNMPMCNQVPSK